MKINTLTILLIVAVAGMCLPLWGQFGGGAGTAANPYLISSVVHLNNIRGAAYLNKTYRQTTDLDLSATDPAKVFVWTSGTPYSPGDYVKYTPGATQYTYICVQATSSVNPSNASYWIQMWESAKGWKPIGDNTISFTGVYDGNGKVVSNLYINRGASPIADNLYPADGEDYVGLFGLVQNNPAADTIIMKLGILNPNVTGRRGTGSLVGRNLLPYSTPAPSYTVIIDRCYAIASGTGGSATVKGLGATGGLVGANNSDRKQQIPIVRYSYAIVTVSSTHPNNVSRNPGDETATNGVFNPYNIKYGGLVGCNENGLTMDSFARGNVSGGDRVGGLVGCSIGGAVFRSYSTGTVAQGIVPGDWEGGKGGLVGRVTGKLPSGLGGTESQANSVQDSYWDTQTSGQATSPGGSGRTTTQMKTQATFINWDFVNVWGISPSNNDGYPFLNTNAGSAFYYRSKASGNWSSLATWEYSSDNLVWNAAVVIPDHSNSLGIIISSGHNVAVNANVIADQMVISAGAQLGITSGVTLSIFNGSGTDLSIEGILSVAGNLVIDLGSLVTAGTASTIAFNGSVPQTTGSLFPTSLNNLEINNPTGVSFTNPLSIDGTLSVLAGSYSGSGTPDGYHSPLLNRLEIFETGSNIAGFSLAVSTPVLFPDRIDRQWTLGGSFSGTKTLRFYWTSTDDHGFDWTGKTPAAWEGLTKISAVSFDVSTNPRWLEISSASFAAKGAFTIGLESEDTLPVELSSFTASVSVSNFALLQWITQSETNVAGFRLYRNTLPELTGARMLNVYVPATNTSQTQTYAYIDQEINEPGTYYYWLQNLDMDGSNAFHGPVSVNLITQDDPGIPVIPIQSGIYRIFPNPFNPNASISYGLKSSTNVELSIFNLRGQLIRTLHSGAKQAGTYRADWDGRTDSGDPASSGIYLLMLKTGSETFTRRMTLSK